MTQETPKPGPHLHQPPTLAELAELHARYAHEAATLPPEDDDRVLTKLLPVLAEVAWEMAQGEPVRGSSPSVLLKRASVITAEVHAAVARACAHAAIANRPLHTVRGVRW